MMKDDDGQEEEEEKEVEMEEVEIEDLGRTQIGRKRTKDDDWQEEAEDEDEDLGRKQNGRKRRTKDDGVQKEEEEEDEEEEGEVAGHLVRKQSGKKRKRNAVEDEEEGEEDDDDHDDGGRRDRNSGDGERGEEEENDDDEANADLSLRIVAKAEKRRKKKSGSSSAAATGGLEYVEHAVNNINTTAVIVAESSGLGQKMESFGGGNLGVEEEEEEEGEVVEIEEPAARSESPEEGELKEDADGNEVLATELPIEAVVEDDSEGRGKKKKKKKKEKKEKKKKQRGGISGDINNQSRGISDKALVIEVKDGDAEENMVMRKLLRGPRYFDPPEEQGQACFNCGKVGHLAAACPDGPRLKPCYVCGGFGHDGRDCPQKTECYVCGQIGHIARNCPNKGVSRFTVRDTNSVCLLCGHPGHEASACYHSYDEEDLEQVQCYVCKDYGHLCCVAVVDTSPMPVSCFDCGEMGHTGAGCARPRRNDRDRDRERDRERGPAAVCFKCGEEGHYARGCSKRNAPWPPSPWPAEGQGGLAGNDRYQPRSARAPRWMDIQQREPRWPSSRRVNSFERWTESRVRVEESLVVDAKNDDIDSYMGPIENFASPPVDGYRQRRKRSWTSTPAR